MTVVSQVSKDDRSDVESSSDEDVSSTTKKISTQSFKPKDVGRMANLNGGTHERWVWQGPFLMPRLQWRYRLCRRRLVFSSINTSHARSKQQHSSLPAIFKHCCSYFLYSSYYFFVAITTKKCCDKQPHNRNHKYQPGHVVCWLPQPVEQSW